MAYVTRMMRQKMANEADEARHPERVFERVASRRAHEQALADMRVRFPVLTANNFAEANAYRETRARELGANQ
jgi:hypothetical protein